MPCYYPRYTYDSDKKIVQHPCGKCIGCRLEYSRQWAMRCIHEAQLYNDNSFITLTYNDENLPDDASLCMSHLQKFIKRYRKKISPLKLRFFACGEYGKICINCGLSFPVCKKKGCGNFVPTIGRPHYHMCVFGHDFPDKELVYRDYQTTSESVFYKKTPKEIWTSKMLASVWKKGFCSIGNLTFESAGYVARYVTKKINGKMAFEHYKGKTPEFATMSRMFPGGIGKPWLNKFKTDCYPKDFCTINGRKFKPPKYYDRLIQKEDPLLYENIKEKRKLQMELTKQQLRKEGKDFQTELWKKEKHTKLITKTLDRRLENE